MPFTGDAPVEIAMKHLSAIPEPPSKLRSDVPHELDAVVMRALAKDPDERFDSAEEMDADLARVARGLAVSQADRGGDDAGAGGAGDAAATMVTRPRRRRRRRRLSTGRRTRTTRSGPRRRSVWPWILGLLALAIAGGTGYLLYDRIQEQLNENRPVTVVDVGQIQANAREAAARGAGVPGPHGRAAPNKAVAIGAVIAQDPAGGEPRRRRASTVTSVVSTGMPKSTVPEVRGLSQTDAIAAAAPGRA